MNNKDDANTLFNFNANPNLVGHTAILGQSGAGKADTTEIIQDMINNRDEYLSEPFTPYAKIWHKKSMRNDNND